MRIIFILRSVVLHGGIERVLIEKANWLADHGHKVLFLTYEQGTHPFSFQLSSNALHKDLECRYFTIYQKNLLERPFRRFLMRRMFWRKLKDTIDDFSPDIMVMPHNLDEYQDIIVSMNSLVPIVMEWHSTSTEFMDKTFRWKEFWRKRSYMSCVKKCSMTVCLTEGDSSFWKQYCRHVVTMSNPLSRYPEETSEKIRKPGRIICVSRLQHVKRIDRLIDAFALISDRHPEWYVDIYGDGPEQGNLQKSIERHGLIGRIYIHEPTNQIFEEYQSSQMLVMSSDSEGFGLVLVEAMACGIPVVATNCPFGPREIIEEGITGLLSGMDTQDLADKMEWMMTHDIERVEMGHNAYLAAARYEKNRVMAEWERTYLSVL